MTEMADLKGFYEKEALTVARYSTVNFWEKRYHNKRMATIKMLLSNNALSCQSFLDIGCGTGEYLHFAKKFSKCICGLDISRRYIKRSQTSKADGLFVGDSKALPFSEGAFSCVLCSEVIEHIKEQNIALKEIFRVSNHSILISTPNHGVFRQFMARLSKRKLAQVDASVGHVAIRRFADFLGKLEGGGFKVSVAFTMHIFPPTLDALHLPKGAEPIVGLLECFMDRLMPNLGSVTVVYLEFNEGAKRLS
jgi:SAM-dependent methyltransferase